MEANQYPNAKRHCSLLSLPKTSNYKSRQVKRAFWKAKKPFIRERILNKRFDSDHTCRSQRATLQSMSTSPSAKWQSQVSKFQGLTFTERSTSHSRVWNMSPKPDGSKYGCRHLLDDFLYISTKLLLDLGKNCGSNLPNAFISLLSVLLFTKHN